MAGRAERAAWLAECTVRLIAPCGTAEASAPAESAVVRTGDGRAGRTLTGRIVWVAARSVEVAALLAAETAGTVVLISVGVKVAVSTSVEVALQVAVSHSIRPVVASAVEQIPAVIPASAAVHAPAVRAAVGIVETRAAEVIIVAARIAGIDAEVPVAGIPSQRTVEVSSLDVCAVLPVAEDVT